MIVVGEEEHYEELTVVVPSQPEPIIQEIDLRPPQPTPKPSSRHPSKITSCSMSFTLLIIIRGHFYRTKYRKGNS